MRLRIVVLIIVLVSEGLLVGATCYRYGYSKGRIDGSDGMYVAIHEMLIKEGLIDKIFTDKGGD